MGASLKITKDKILDSAFDIVRKEGIEVVSNRKIAENLNTSIRPIYYQFKNSNELNNELYRKMKRYFYRFVLNNINDEMPKYKQVGINYIKFAKEENNIFKALFMTDNPVILEDKSFSITEDYPELKEIESYIKISTKLNDKEVKTIHVKMWLFTHGIATLLASKTLFLSDEQIKSLLSQEFQALMLLEENPNNKWILGGKND